MKKIFFAVATFMILSFGAQASAKYNICTATINSPHERDVFRSQLDPNHFNFIELTDYSSDTSKKTDDWFKRSCEAGVQCDVLVVSGHFGGSFFGETQYSLKLKDMNKQSCQKSCKGILENPKEVYLFGCNTLATKDKDFRDEQTYLRALVEHGVDRREAEQVVAARYGPFGSAFKDQMERAFENVPLIYGFDSVGPSGANIKPQLIKYLKGLGDYKKHLDQVSHASEKNTTWFKNMSAYNAAMGVGLRRENPAYDVKENSCRMTNESLPLAARVDIATNLLEKSPLLYLPSISEFVNETFNTYVDPAASLDAVGKINFQAAMSRLKMNQNIKKFWIDTAQSNGVMLGIRFELLLAAGNLGIIHQKAVDKMMTDHFTDLIKNPTVENSDLVCSTIQDNSSLIKYVRPDAHRGYQMNSKGEFKIVSCLKIKDQELMGKAIQYVSKNRRAIMRDVYFIASVAQVLAQLPGYEEDFKKILESFRAYKGVYQKELRDFLIQISLSKITGEAQVEAIRSIFLARGFDAEDTSALYYLSENPKIEPETKLIVLEDYANRIVRSAENYYPWFSLKIDDAVVQDLTVDLVGKMTLKQAQKFMSGIISRLNQNDERPSARVRSQKMIQYIYSQILESVRWTEGSGSSSNSTVSYVDGTAALAFSPLTSSQIQGLKNLIERKDLNVSDYKDYSSRGISPYAVPFLRHLLYSQALLRRTPMTADLKEGQKSFYRCEKTLNNLSCREQSFQ